MNITELLAGNPVVPLVQADDPGIAVATSRALAAGGLQVAEVVFRTDRALECLQAVAEDVPEMIAGAGTVLTAQQAEAALANGAQFIVSPGLDDGVVAVAKYRGVPLPPSTAGTSASLPGRSTTSCRGAPTWARGCPAESSPPGSTWAG